MVSGKKKPQSHRTRAMEEVMAPGYSPPRRGGKQAEGAKVVILSDYTI